MNDLNIYNDSRNRGTEVLLYRQEKSSNTIENNIKGFRLKLTIPFFFQKRFSFRFEFLVESPQKSPGVN